MRTKYLYMLFFIGYATPGSAQDIHFSQFSSSPLNINPALTGIFSADYRLIANYRNQWSSVTTPFVTYSASGDMNIHPYRFSKDFLGIGLLLNADKAGDADYTVLQFAPSVSYTKALYHQKIFLTYGMQVGVMQQHFNPAALTFDRQYNGSAYDANLSSGESFLNTTSTAFDVSTGFNMFCDLSDRFNLNGGIAIYHLNTPSFSFTNGAFSEITPRYTMYANGSIYMGNGVQLLPGYMILRQSGNSEYTLGGYIRYNVNPKKRARENVAVYGGIWFRARDYDALILTGRLDYDNLGIGVSYDFNTSRLATASKAQGGAELSIVYLFKKIKHAKTSKSDIDKDKKIPCPVYF